MGDSQQRTRENWTSTCNTNITDDRLSKYRLLVV